MSVGKRIKALRKLKKMSQQTLAKLAKISQATVCDYENDVITEHRANIIFQIAAALGTLPDYLMTGRGVVDIKDAPTSLNDLQSIYVGLTPDAQAMLLALARTMEKK
jgi:transcriptional regulator with XRE-family HTH domain